jgi:osmotically inducible protein OsmC
MAISKASATWSGNLKEGKGSMKGARGFFEAPFGFLSRFEGAPAGTNPEELIGAANAGCFSMFLAAQLSAAGHPPTSIETSATVTLGEIGGGPAITKIELETNAVVPGATQALFDEKVAFSKQNCPISRALAGVPEITIKATLG